jgi:hypothetical protein
LKTHGFMAQWTDQDFERYWYQVQERARSLQADASRTTHQRQQATYGEPPIPPTMRRPPNTFSSHSQGPLQRSTDNRPAWMTRPPNRA